MKQFSSEIHKEFHAAAARVPGELLLPILTVLFELGREGRAPCTADTVRRGIGRWRLLQRFAELRESAMYRRRSNYQVLKQVLREAPAIAPGLKCSDRSLLRWLSRWNTIQANGLAAGPGALIDRYGRPPKRVRK